MIRLSLAQAGEVRGESLGDARPAVHYYQRTTMIGCVGDAVRCEPSCTSKWRTDHPWRSGANGNGFGGEDMGGQIRLFAEMLPVVRRCRERCGNFLLCGERQIEKDNRARATPLVSAFPAHHLPVRGASAALRSHSRRIPLEPPARIHTSIPTASAEATSCS